ncbi:MAG: 50S ribosomal protein L35 [Candidatus Portnoybacteria bacterium]|nr:50S ribosomal protein L35 [Candidatus Portnoybacteria bacterium]MDD5438382.1 50S ribosomal protein L35 [Patescibacteria group bacterium]
MKTCKALAKRVRVTKSGKVMKRHGGQDHFNSRDSGKITRKKRRDQTLAKQYVRTVKALLPFAK